MRVTVRLFARLRDITGSSELVRDVGEGTARQVWNDLVKEFPPLGAYTASISVAINTDYARLDGQVKDGDEVAFLPPVSGG
jgi:molybdopterin synthase sulfur carrier subunit